MQKPSKESGIFQSLSDICSFITKRQSRKGGGGHSTIPYSLNTLLQFAKILRDRFDYQLEPIRFTFPVVALEERKLNLRSPSIGDEFSVQ